MSELEIFLWLTQLPNTSMQMSRNKGATKKASRKMVHDKVFFNFLAKRPFLYPEMVAPPKQIISHKSVHWYQCISLWKMLGGDIRFMTKKTFCVKKHFFVKNALFPKNNVSTQILFWG